MKNFTYGLFVPALLFCVFNVDKAEALELKYRCNLPFWNAPAESKEGLFTGDLSLECSIESEVKSHFNMLSLRKRIIDKIQSESLVHQGPVSSSSISTTSSLWDVSHRFEEDGNSIKIRELIEVSIESKDQLKYQTHSKEIVASGMAGYLRSVEFTMIVKRKQHQMSVYFRNRVQVKRPWYALDLIFAPIARKICLKKLDQVKDKFMPWITTAIR
jgi:hypothetical protein